MISKKYVLVITVMFMLNSFSKSQMILIPEVQSNGIVLRQQIFSCLVNNFTGSTKTGIFVIQIVDRSNSQVLLEATSNQVLINTGSKRITYSELSPLLVSQSVSEFSLDRAMSLPIPVGEYLICYKILDVENKRDVLASECINISSESLSPPQLVFPGDGTTLDEPRPVFSWTPPSPVTMFSSLSYEILVTAKFKGQSSEEAIQRNLPLIMATSSNNSFPFPASYSDLEAGKDYVWQVVARDGNRYGGKSEVWNFTLVPDSVKMIIETAAFVKIQEARTEAVVLHQGTLKIDYVNDLSDSIVKVRITDMTELNNKEISFDIKVTRGQNLVKKGLNRLGRLEEGHMYRITIINSRKEEYSFRFIPKYYF